MYLIIKSIVSCPELRCAPAGSPLGNLAESPRAEHLALDAPDPGTLHNIKELTARSRCDFTQAVR
jgi:hypothetical protein